MAGLRRNEIDKLPWSAFRWDEGVIHIQATEFLRPKSRESEGDIPVDPGLMEIFRGYHAHPHGGFVIESESAPDNGKPDQAEAGVDDGVLKRVEKARDLFAPVLSLKQKPLRLAFDRLSNFVSSADAVR